MRGTRRSRSGSQSNDSGAWSLIWNAMPEVRALPRDPEQLLEELFAIFPEYRAEKHLRQIGAEKALRPYLSKAARERSRA